MRVTCKSLQNSPPFSQSVLKGAKCRRRLCKINSVFPATTFHLLYLECDKVYEIGVSSWFGEVQSDWSVSWKFKTHSEGATLPYVCPIADRDLV